MVREVRKMAKKISEITMDRKLVSTPTSFYQGLSEEQIRNLKEWNKKWEIISNKADENLAKVKQSLGIR